ncbi:MAG: MerR family transcriptional regulator [Aequorivita sp.]|nr:MerR family transcriptional regulator [Aequorivita sp.]|tara:strand:+ start:126498 stop:126788 length:291 start_codon:yes stop_codon:yes gene_type:complete
MAQEKYILVKHYCKVSKIEDSFLNRLHEFGLITFKEQQNDIYIDEQDISEIERMFRLHHDLGINFEGLDAIKEMLARIQQLEEELNYLQKKLRLYE